MRQSQRIHSSRDNRYTSPGDRLPSHPVVQPKSEKKAQMPEWQVNPDNWQVNFQNPLGGMYGHGMTPPVQAKLTIGEVGDKYEREADRVASEVVQKIHSPEPGTVKQQANLPEEEQIQRKFDPTLAEILAEGANRTPVQAKPVGNEGVSQNVEHSIQQAQGGGQLLNDKIRQPMERAMGADFSGVRIHNDSQSDRLSNSIQAKAFTTGQDIFFKQGEYSPSSRGGQELLAHELTHVVQQNNDVSLQRKEISVSQTASPDRIQRVSDFENWLIGERYEAFYRHCKKEYSTENLDFYQDVLHFNMQYMNLSNPETSTGYLAEAKRIWKKYENGSVINISGSDMRSIKKVFKTAKVDIDVKGIFGTYEDYNGAFNSISRAISDSFTRFTQTDEYQQLSNSRSGRSRNLGVTSDREVSDRQITSLSDLSALMVRQNQN